MVSQKIDFCCKNIIFGCSLGSRGLSDQAHQSTDIRLRSRTGLWGTRWSQCQPMPVGVARCIDTYREVEEKEGAWSGRWIKTELWVKKIKKISPKFFFQKFINIWTTGGNFSPTHQHKLIRQFTPKYFYDCLIPPLVSAKTETKYLRGQEKKGH